MAVLLSAGFAGVAGAVPITVGDPYGGQNPGTAHSNGDVIGRLADFDIESITFTQLSQAGVAAAIRFNYHGGDATLADWQFNPPSGPTLAVGDLLFGVNGSYKYGVALVAHDGYAAGSLYSVSGARTSNDPAYMGTFSGQYIWRFNTAVRMNTGGTLVGAGTASTVNVGYNELETTLLFASGESFWTDLTSTPGGVSVHFASAICANDVIDGTLPAPVPEPTSLFLLGTGLAGLMGTAWRRRRRN